MVPRVLFRIYSQEGSGGGVRYLVEKDGGGVVRDRLKEIHPKDQELTPLLAAFTPAVAARCSERSGR
jgi:hypothetical protein